MAPVAFCGLRAGRFASIYSSMVIRERERIKLAAETGFSLRTVSKWATSKPVTASTDKALREAAKRLKIELREETA